MSHEAHAEIVRGWSAENLARFPLECFRHTPETFSTNDDLLQLVRSGEAAPFTLVAADHQTGGRGRRGDRWESPPGRNLLFSLALPLELDRRYWTRLPLLTAAIVGSVVESVCGPGYRLQAKWPNDLLHENRKLAGVLVETVLLPRPCAVVGIGLNVNLRNEELPPELRDQAVSIYEMIGCESSRWFLLGLIVREFLQQFPGGLVEFEPTLDWIRSRDPLLGRRLAIRRGQEWIEGTARGIGNSGELRFEDLEGRHHDIVSADEIRR